MNKLYLNHILVNEVDNLFLYFQHGAWKCLFPIFREMYETFYGLTYLNETVSICFIHIGWNIVSRSFICIDLK